ncbi:Olfactory receptor 7C1 [Sciurus carolinensis]|uniref:Olfactory receptor n=1 Tax=Sciurus carolinensis TaxID=30640 RepID=A0AA41N5K7_SCICA|nr:Olfactory receptor 7C1 [Sciurus carolinensis]
MESTNQRAVSEFLLLVLTDDPALQSLIFCLFLSMCLDTILGNLLIILAIYSDSHIHTPMYFFLCNLSFSDICISMTTIPKMLVNILRGDQSINYTGCLTQVAFVMLSSYWENFLLAVMAYDHYVAICHPLRYTVIMKPCLCVLLVHVSLFVSIVDALLHTLLLLRLSFCRDPEVPQFFCEFAQVIKLSCSDTFTDNLIILVAVTINNMKFSKETAISEFLLLGLTEDPALQPLIFSCFLSMYLVTVLAVSSDPHLHTPMYFFLCCLSFNDIGYTTCTIPEMLVNSQTEDHTITYTGCLTQVSFVIIFALMESFLLVVMAYDRYVAICHPLSSAVTDSPKYSAVASVMYTVVPQMLNPFIYSLRNRDMKEDLRKLFDRIGSLL